MTQPNFWSFFFFTYLLMMIDILYRKATLFKQHLTVSFVVFASFKRLLFSPPNIHLSVTSSVKYLRCMYDTSQGNVFLLHDMIVHVSVGFLFVVPFIPIIKISLFINFLVLWFLPSSPLFFHLHFIILQFLK